VTTLHVLPGSINLFAGLTVALKTVPATTAQAMKVPEFRPALKLSYGENPKKFYGSKGQFPSSRMGAVAGMREGWVRAQAYLRAWRAYEAGEARAPPDRDLALDSLAAALAGEAVVHIHCYRADDMATMVGIAREFGYRIAAFHHAIEAYKIAPLLAAEGIAAVVWSDWWGFKMEALDGLRENAAIADAAGVRVALHSDSWVTGERLTLEAGKAMAAGRRMGLDIAPERAISWVTLNAARVLGLDANIGSLAVGKNADVVMWSGDPFSVYSKAERVWIDGALALDRGGDERRPIGDLELGQPSLGWRP
jgi:imidazolonepropionase-like amidohydrolase